MIEKEFEFLLEIKDNCLLEKAIECLGIVEFPDEDNNPVIMSWAEELKKDWYRGDDHAWCALFMSYIVHTCGYQPPLRSLKSLNWLEWGETIETPEPGDILIFKRSKGGHIGLFVKEEGEYYWTLGGNQRKGKKDSVNIKKIKKSKCVRVCRPIDVKIDNNETSKDQEDSTS